MYISGIQYESIVDGEGLRLTLFISGCNWNCVGCQNTDSHNFTNGREFDVELQNHIINYIKNNPMIKGITLSGGDPMFSAIEVLGFVTELKTIIPSINVWCYTGFTFEEIIERDDAKTYLLYMCDVLVDGKFEISKRDITLAYKGSSNQRCINVQESLKQDKVILWED
jgi:anaerobic ribonucleoside-triphosphate reductase activating protein